MLSWTSSLPTSRTRLGAFFQKRAGAPTPSTLPSKQRRNRIRDLVTWNVVVAMTTESQPSSRANCAKPRASPRVLYG